MINDAGMPGGVLALAALLVEPAAPLLRSVTKGCPSDEIWLENQLMAPLNLGDPAAPRIQPTATGYGWVQPEIIEEDTTLLDAMVDQYGDRGPEVLAARCQELRLPVCPYRTLPGQLSQVGRSTRSVSANTNTNTNTNTPDPPSRRLVIDMTTHWAGPLATMLLADAGATIIKVDPDCRADGFRGQPELYRHLNGAKEVLDLDLRIQRQRDRFEHLVGKADLLIESFSRRVMQNLGYSTARLRTINPSLRVLSVKAFPGGSACQDWLAFGPGVHAMSGLALCSSAAVEGTPTTPSVPTVAYPDFLTGLAGFIEGLRLLGSPEPDESEVTLAGTIQPLVHDAVSARCRSEQFNV